MANPLLQSLITPLSRNLGTDGIIEARFGTFNIDRFYNGISRSTWNRILTTFREKLQPTLETRTDYINGSIRKSVQDSGATWFSKKQVWYQDVSEYGLRITINRKNTISEIPDFQPTLIRHIQAYRFPLGNGLAELILIHSSVDGSHAADDRFELEVKLRQSTQISNFMSILNAVIQQILNTADPYTLPERTELFAEVNQILGVQMPRHGGLAPGVLVQARNLKIQDVVSHGLISAIGYTVSHKIDGSRRLLVIVKSGIWLITDQGEANRLTKRTIPTLVGTIVDGELIPKSQRLSGAPSAAYWMVIFDALAYESSPEIQKQSHYNRMLVAQQAVDLINQLNLSYLAVNTNKFVALDTNADLNRPLEFFNKIQRMAEEVSTLTYKTDGFMFRPERSPYNPNSDRKPLSERILTRYPDVCKWKPPNMNTIDFGLEWKIQPSGARDLQLMSWEQGKLIPFPIGGVADVDDPMIATLPSGTIVEFEWKDNSFHPIRVRYDKWRPNRLEIAMDNYEQIQNPLTLETLEGQTFDLVKAYHQRERKKYPSAEYGMDMRLVQQLLQPPVSGPHFDSLTLGTKTLRLIGSQLEVKEGDQVEIWNPMVIDEPVIRLESELVLSPPERIWSRLFVIKATPELSTTPVVPAVSLAPAVSRPPTTPAVSRTPAAPAVSRTPAVSRNSTTPAVSKTPATTAVSRTPATTAVSRTPATTAVSRPPTTPSFSRASAASPRSELPTEPLPVITSPVPGWTAESTPGDDSMEPFVYQGRNYVRLGTLNGLLHAVLKGYLENYQNHPQLTYRTALVNRLQKEIQLSDSDLLPRIPEILGINVVVLSGKGVERYTDPKDPHWSVILLKIGNHYETVGVDDGKSIQTTFPPNDSKIFV